MKGIRISACCGGSLRKATKTFAGALIDATVLELYTELYRKEAKPENTGQIPRDQNFRSEDIPEISIGEIITPSLIEM